MKKSLFVNKIQVKESPVHGYGVFAKKTIHKGEVIEECIALLEEKTARESSFYNYLYRYGDISALLTGNGSIYNHSMSPNADYTFEGRIFTFKAKQTIYPGQEIFIKYTSTWFAERGMQDVVPVVKWGLIHNPVTSKFMRLSAILILGLGIYFAVTILDTYTFISHAKNYSAAATPQKPLNQRSTRMPNLPG